MACERVARPSAWIVVLGMLVAARARAEDASLAVAGVVAETRGPVVAPIFVLRAPIFDASMLTVSQVGWTSRVVVVTADRPELSLRTSIELTPLRARLSHSVYDEQGHALDRQWEGTSLRATLGPQWTRGSAVAIVHGVFDKEWLTNADAASTQACRWAFVGMEALFSIAMLRAEDPLQARIDGARLRLRAQSLHGATAWNDAEANVDLGHRSGRFFLTLRASTFYTQLAALPARFVLGGSWDLLSTRAVVGHPLGAFRPTTGGNGTAGIDLRVIGALELGARVSILATPSSVHGGVALLAQGVINGVHVFAGVGMPDTRLDDVIGFGGLQTALLL